MSMSKERYQSFLEQLPELLCAEINAGKEMVSQIFNFLIHDVDMDVDDFINAMIDDGYYSDLVSDDIDPESFVEIAQMAFTTDYDVEGEMKKIVRAEVKRNMEDLVSEALDFSSNIVTDGEG